MTSKFITDPEKNEERTIGSGQRIRVMKDDYIGLWVYFIIIASYCDFMFCSLINNLRGWMYVIIGSHFSPFEGKFLLIALVIVRVTLNVTVHQMPLNVCEVTVCP